MRAVSIGTHEGKGHTMFTFRHVLVLLAGLGFTATLVLLCALPVGPASALAVTVFTALTGVLTHMVTLAHEAEELTRHPGSRR